MCTEHEFQLRSVLFRGITQRRVVILYWRFGTAYQSHLQGSRSPRIFLDFLMLEDGTNMLSQNIGKGSPLDTALYPRRAQISSASRQEPEIADEFQL
jgi:hypothetical protein